MPGLDEIKYFLESDQFIISNHARMRMFQRNITTDMTMEIINGGEVIEEYPDDFPCPSVLILGYCNEKPFHVVVGQCEDHARVITVYIPDEEYWIEHKKRKRKS
jgi:hypothetical protein